MTQHTIKTPNAIITYSTVDAVFTWEGRKVNMEFHRYCGPSFFYTDDEGDEHEVDNWYEIPELLAQWNTWWEENNEFY